MFGRRGVGGMSKQWGSSEKLRAASLRHPPTVISTTHYRGQCLFIVAIRDLTTIWR